MDALDKIVMYAKSRSSFPSTLTVEEAEKILMKLRRSESAQEDLEEACGIIQNFIEADLLKNPLRTTVVLERARKFMEDK